MTESASQKGVRLGAAYMYNIWLPLITIGIGLFFAVVFSFFSIPLAFLAFCGCLAGGYFARKWAKNKFKPAYSDLSGELKRNGYLCERCGHTFLPAVS